jgi:3-oxoacid CoA-transferase subunit B
MIITDLCVLKMDADRSGCRRFVLTELAPGITADEVRKKTTAEFIVADHVTAVSV